nr:IclR family transcriptional regulator [Marinicaulis flavus]
MILDNKNNSERRGIQSIERGLEIIQALQKSDGPMSLKNLAAASRLPASNCHRYCVSFVKMGYLKQDARSGHYDLGYRLLEAGLAVMRRTDAISIASESLENLVEETGQTGLLSIWCERGPTIIRWIAGSAAVRTSITTGSLLPLTTSATGQVFLSYLPQHETKLLLDAEEKQLADYKQLCEKIRKAGVARVSGTHIPGLSAAAAPILDTFGVATSALTIIAARKAVTAETVDLLIQYARHASWKLGWSDKIEQSLDRPPRP